MDTFDRGDTRVALAGDWHGSVSWVQRAVPHLRRLGFRTVYHLGDLGFWGPRDPFLDSLEYWLNLGDIRLFCTPGNHEQWAALDEMFAATPGEPVQLSPHVWMLPRGFRWTHGGRSFLSLGGAPSIDVAYRQRGKSWWPTEAITDDDVAAVAAGGHASVMLTHDAPERGTNAVRSIRVVSDDPQFALDDDMQAYADAGMHRLEAAFTAVAPELLVHGHYHRADAITLPSGQRVVSLGSDRAAGNLAVLDLANLAVSFLPDPK